MTQTDLKLQSLQLQGLSDPRLALHAVSALPAWLWSADGSQVWWANAVGARVFGAANGAVLAARRFTPADAHRRQVAQLARQLPENGATRLERLRGFGAPLGMLATCGCARIDLADGTLGILVTATAAGPRTMPLVERLQRLVDDSESVLLAFTTEGIFAGASATGRRLFELRDLSAPGVAHACRMAAAQGRAEIQLGPHPGTVYRVGSGDQSGLVAVITPRIAAPVRPSPPPAGGDTSIPAAALASIIEVLEAANAQLKDHAANAFMTNDSSPPDEQEPTDDNATAPASTEDSALTPRRHPLRFMWQMDAEERFSLGSQDFIRLIGPQTAARVDHKPWQEIASAFGLDPDGRIDAAIASRETWSGIAVDWPVDGGARLVVELAGLPLFDDSRIFEGYRGFGVCRDLDALEHLAAQRDAGIVGEISTIGARAGGMSATRWQPVIAAETQDTQTQGTELQGNVVPFRATGETRFPTLTPGENSAFHELARQLSARLENDARAAAADNVTPVAQDHDDEPPALEPHASEPAVTVQSTPAPVDLPAAATDHSEPAAAEWLTPEDPPAQGDAARDRVLLDLMPTGILIYRLDRLLYANPAFLASMGYHDLAALEQAGGLDALYVEAGVPSQSSTSRAGTPVTISAADGSASAGISAAAQLFAISWDGDAAHALIFAPRHPTASVAADAPAVMPPTVTLPVITPVAPSVVAPQPEPEPQPEPVMQAEPEPLLQSEPEPVAQPEPASPEVVPPEAEHLEAGHADAEDLGAILDATTDGIVMFDADGNIHACNRSAQAMFGYDGDQLTQRNLAELVATESATPAMSYFAAVKDATTDDQVHEIFGRGNHGDIGPLAMTIGRTRADGPNFFAVFRDLSQTRRGENELLQARRLADRGANAKADMLARISHEIRAPLNAIIGFAEVMIGERFGALGNERYGEYMKDIRGSGERVIAIIDDLLELTRIETGKVDLAFTSQNLNELVEACVATMQPQANRGRIIIRTSLSHVLPPVVADERALRQIVQNLVSASISLANAGGQVIVSTALSDLGEVVLRVRDTGHGLNDREVAAALAPFRAAGPSEQATENSGLNLSMTKALVEANRAQLHIKAAPQSGTLMEVVFSRKLQTAAS